MAKAYVFPGQGAQFVGMGKDLYESNAKAKEMFDTYSCNPPLERKAMLR